MHPERLTEIIKAMAAEILADTIQLRRSLHQNPELSFQEYRTSELIYTILKEIPGLEVAKAAPTSVVARLRGARQGKILAVRSDIDALALQEENTLEYKSRNDGVMHACGHDGHIAMLIGAAKILARLVPEIRGEIRFIFQHAEEKPPGGAGELVKQGVLDGVDMILGSHLWVPLPVGKIGIARGCLMASPDNFKIRVEGKGGHAGMPQEVTDPIVTAAHLVASLQTVVSRRQDPLKPLVLSITGIQGGTAYNVIPNRVEIKGTVRTFDSDSRKTVPEIMENIIKGVCLAFGANYEFSYELGYDPVINDGAMVDRIAEIMVRTLGAGAVEWIEPVMSAEDFSAYLRLVPGVFLFIGAGNVEQGIVSPHHSARFNIDETALAHGMTALVAASLQLLDESLTDPGP